MTSRLHYDSRTSQTITLEDGRTLGYAEYGPATGRPIFHLHGLPGSRFEGKLFEPAAFLHNARIISIDRPGVGLSSPQPGRTAIDHARDVQALAAHLKLNTFAVMGVSGGGPYGFACAYAIPPSQLTKSAIVVGCGTWKSETAKGMHRANSWVFWGFNTVPWAVDLYIRWTFGRMLRNPDEGLDAQTQDDQGGSSQTTPASPDRNTEAYSDEEIHRILMTEIREHFKQGYASYTEDGKIIAGELELDIPEDRCKQVTLWYGKQDVSVPLAIGEDYAKRLKGKARLRVEDETHIGMVQNWAGEILSDLLADK